MQNPSSITWGARRLGSGEHGLTLAAVYMRSPELSEGKVQRPKYKSKVQRPKSDVINAKTQRRKDAKEKVSLVVEWILVQLCRFQILGVFASWRPGVSAPWR